MSWSDAYIGIPFAPFGRDRAGCDCWGLVALVYREVLGIALPDYRGYASVEERAEIAALIAGAAGSPVWANIELRPPAPFDVAVFRVGRLDSHLGLIVRPGLMLHVSDGQPAALADIRSGYWAPRLRGLYRHASRQALGAVA